jgi:ABC-type bacteriocin/lantibiotic exporter with double-glycine peptidase domain
LDSISKIDEKTYRNLSVSLDELEDRIASISPDNASKTYWDVTNRMEEMKKIVDSKRESLMSDIAKLSLVLITLLLISVVSITMLILRVWRGETGGG